MVAGSLLKDVYKRQSISGEGRNSGALFGVQSQSPHSQLWIEGNSLVDSPAQNNYDTGGSQLENAYIVLGGSHHVKYVPNYNSSYGSTVPVNGEANGNEKLFLFTLADSSIEALTPICLLYTSRLCNMQATAIRPNPNTSVGIRPPKIYCHRLKGSAPVSYTHLDVYKRQSLLSK